MSWVQREIRLNERRRGMYNRDMIATTKKLISSRILGCHLVHKEIVGQLPELKSFKIGMANVFCKLILHS